MFTLPPGDDDDPLCDLCRHAPASEEAEFHEAFKHLDRGEILCLQCRQILHTLLYRKGVTSQPLTTVREYKLVDCNGCGNHSPRFKRLCPTCAGFGVMLVTRTPLERLADQAD